MRGDDVNTKLKDFLWHKPGCHKQDEVWRHLVPLVGYIFGSKGPLWFLKPRSLFHSFGLYLYWLWWDVSQQPNCGDLETLRHCNNKSATASNKSGQTIKQVANTFQFMIINHLIEANLKTQLCKHIQDKKILMHKGQWGIRCANFIKLHWDPSKTDQECQPEGGTGGRGFILHPTVRNFKRHV